MKISVAASVIIVLLFTLLGWRNHVRLAVARETNKQLAAQAEVLGIASGENASTRSSSRRERPGRGTDAKALADDIIAFSLKMDADKEKEPTPEEAGEIHKQVLELMERFASLDAAEMKLLIDHVRADASLTEEARHGIVMFSLTTLSLNHPRSALELFTHSSDLLEGDRRSNHYISTALTSWAKQDPEAAIAWFRENTTKSPDFVDNNAKMALLKGVSTRDPSRALGLFSELGIKPTDREYPQAMVNLALAATTPSQRSAFLEALRKHAAETGESSVNGIKQAVQRLGNMIAAEGFDSATTWLADAKLTEKERSAFGEGLAEQIKDGDQAKWIGWMETNLPDSNVHNSIFLTVADWTRKDPRAAGEWLASTEEGIARTHGIRAYSMEVAPYDPATAEQWALTIPPGKNRNTALRGVHGNWPKSDPEGAAAFVTRHNLSTD